MDVCVGISSQVGVYLQEAGCSLGIVTVFVKLCIPYRTPPFSVLLQRGCSLNLPDLRNLTEFQNL